MQVRGASRWHQKRIAVLKTEVRNVGLWPNPVPKHVLPSSTHSLGSSPPLPPSSPAAAPPPRAPAAAHSLNQWSMPSLSFLERANQSRYRFQFNRFSSRVSSFQSISMQFMPLHRTQEIARFVHASGKFPPYEFASSIVGFDTSAAALTAHAEPLRYTRIQFPLFALKMFPGLETASKGF